MPTVAHRKEIEVKLRVPDIDAVRAQLKRLRVREIVPRTYESNTLYDTPRQDLRRRGQIIRIRIERLASRADKADTATGTPAVLTYKGPAPRSRPAQSGRDNSRARFKIKEEAEVSVTDADVLARILRRLGLRPSFRYEKFRTTYSLSSVPGLKIELDETPIGVFLELEGPAPSIDRAARLLGYTQKDYSSETYGSLYLAECRRRRRKPGHMLFPTKKSPGSSLFP